MSERDEFYFLRFEHRPLTPEQTHRLQQEGARQAKEARARAVRGLLNGIASSLRAGAAGGGDRFRVLVQRVAAATGKGWKAYATWLAHRAAVRELQGLDDRALKDLGVHRSEIESVVYGRGSRRVGEGKVAAYLFHKPYQHPSPGLDPEAMRLIKTSWQKVVPIADAAAELFYQRLFEIDPTTRKLFRATAMVEQRRKLVKALSLAVEGLDNVDALVPVLEDLGRRHSGYGVGDAHYASVSQALLATLEQGLGRSWTPAMASAWTEACALLSGVMRQAARDAAAQATRAKAA